MNEEPPRKKGFWESLPSQGTVASIMAITLGATLIIVAITTGAALLQQKHEISGVISDMFTTVLGAIVGALSVYVGIKKNGEK